MNEIVRMVARAAGYPQATWFWHTWVAGVITLGLWVLWIPWGTAAWMAWAFFLAREIRDVGVHVMAKDPAWGRKGWVLDGILDMVGPTLIVVLANGFG